MALDLTDIPPCVLCLGAGDATGGGGLASDILTLASMGCHPLPVQTAVLLRDTRNVDEVWAVDADVVVAQARAVLEDIPVAAIKLGFCGSVENVAAIAEVLSDYPDLPLVIEPALYAGGDLGEVGDEIADVFADLVLPQATLVVVGRHELCRLAGVAEHDEDEDEDDEEREEGDGGRENDGEDEGEDRDAAAERHEGAEGEGEDDDAFGAGSADVVEALGQLFARGTEFVLLTGGGEHRPQVVNSLLDPEGLVRTDAWPRLPGRFLGAGGTLAGAVAAGLAHGMAMPEAVREAQEFTQQALLASFRPGMGLAIPDRFFWARGEQDGEGGEESEASESQERVGENHDRH